MAATTLNIAPLPIARSAAVDLDFGGTLAGRQISVSGPAHFAPDGYLMVGPEIVPTEMPIYGSSSIVTFISETFAADQGKYVVIGEKTLTTSRNLTAATMSRTFSPLTRPSFYPDLRLSTSEFWWTGDSPSVSISIPLRDRRLEPFYERLARIERGEWDADLGRQPNETALMKAKAILDQLAGGPIVPNKVVGGDGLIAIYFAAGERYSNIEILSSGLMLLMLSDGHTTPSVKRFALPKLPTIIDQIRAHIA